MSTAPVSSLPTTAPAPGRFNHAAATVAVALTAAVVASAVLDAVGALRRHHFPDPPAEQSDAPREHPGLPLALPQAAAPAAPAAPTSVVSFAEVATAAGFALTGLPVGTTAITGARTLTPDTILELRYEDRAAAPRDDAAALATAGLPTPRTIRTTLAVRLTIDADTLPDLLDRRLEWQRRAIDAGWAFRPSPSAGIVAVLSRTTTPTPAQLAAGITLARDATTAILDAHTATLNEKAH